MNDNPAYSPPADSTTGHSDQPSTTETQALTARAAQAWDATKEKTAETLKSGERYIQEHPGYTALGVFSAGMVLGLLAGWRMARDERDDYADCARDFFQRWGHKLNLS